ncbi:MAG: flavodoxin domain-containing protein [Eubacteriales bacterium]|nr:flavodoxin domain-containing protein [Eubacteriales bacterium]
MKIKLVYKSKSGFTKQYAEWIAQETGCELIPEKAANISDVKGCDVLVYGSRMHAGRVDGLSQARKLFAGSGAKHFIVFATGGMPCSAVETVEEMWKNNLTAEELESIPHFYMQAGICYEKLGLVDKAMMKMAASMMAKQAEKNPMEAQIVKAVQGSYDISDKQYIVPLVGFLRGL